MMKHLTQLICAFLFLLYSTGSNAQEQQIKPVGLQEMMDSLRRNGVVFERNTPSPEIILSKEEALNFLQKKIRPSYWRDPADPFRSALNVLVTEASSQRYDSVELFLRQYPYDSISIPWEQFYVWEPLILKIPAVSTITLKPDTGAVSLGDSLRKAGADTLALKPIEALPVEQKYFIGLKDTTIMVIKDTLETATLERKEFPFKYMEYPYQTDSIRIAVQALLDYVQQRDSSILNITGAGQPSIPVWINTKTTGTMRRYWLRNEYDDSVTVWIGNEGRNTIGLYLEQGIAFRRPMRHADYSEARIDVQKVDRSTLEKQNIVVINRPWKYRTESSLLFSQSALSNWVKGGENSISTALDVTGFLDYKKPEIKLSSSNFARLKLGFMASGSEDIRKNLDLLETNTKVNHKAFGKFDFSAIILFKTQLAIGKSYTKVGGRDTSFVVSRFMNPSVLTLGFGLDYKPNKETSINFSPLSYKGTFVPAGGKITADSLVAGKIDQTRYGVELGKRSKHEPGASFQISRISRPLKNVTITNRLQLFTNYINHPQNIDVDWEMIAVYNLNWFTDLRLNTHLIFDDDTRTTVIESGVPVLLEDGTEKKTARVQFKEIFGVSLMFKF